MLLARELESQVLEPLYNKVSDGANNQVFKATCDSTALPEYDFDNRMYNQLMHDLRADKNACGRGLHIIVHRSVHTCKHTWKVQGCHLHYHHTQRYD